MLVVDPKTQRLRIRVRDFVGYLGLTTITVGYIEVHVSQFCLNPVRVWFLVVPFEIVNHILDDVS
jgi:hypothetical protein